MFAQHLVHKTVLSIVALGRVCDAAVGPLPLRLAWTQGDSMDLVGFMVLMLAYFGSKAVVELILRR